MKLEEPESPDGHGVGVGVGVGVGFGPGVGVGVGLLRTCFSGSIWEWENFLFDNW